MSLYLSTMNFSRVDGEGAEDVGGDFDEHREDEVEVDVAGKVSGDQADSVVHQRHHSPAVITRVCKFRDNR